MITAAGLQQLIVVACVLAATLYLLRRWIPRRFTLRLRAVAASMFERLGQSDRAQRLREPATLAAAACGSGCGSCGGCDKPKPVPATEQRVHFHRPKPATPRG